MISDCLVTTICGCTQFRTEIERTASILDQSGKFIVFHPHVFPYDEGVDFLDRPDVSFVEAYYDLSLSKKMQLSDAIHVVNLNGTLNQHVIDIIKAAFLNEKDVYFMFVDDATGCVICSIFEELPLEVSGKYSYFIDDLPCYQFHHAYCANGRQPIFF